ncbi:MAG: 50S ribosomal protein L29 [bacterium]|nr:50S ribosomal protein L29 [bacterium]
MNIQELRQLSLPELHNKLLEARQRLHFVREEVASGKDKNHAQARVIKKEIAQISTCISTLSHS